jgi:hypothetical protein
MDDDSTDAGADIPSDFLGQELSPVQRDFLAYWRRQAGGRIAPSRGALDVLDVPTLMPHVIFFDVLHDPLDFRYRLVGTAVRAMSVRDYTGMTLREIEGRGPGSQIWLFLDGVRIGRAPVCHSVPYVGPKKDFVTLHNLFLPLVDEAGKTDMVVVVSHFQPR